MPISKLAIIRTACQLKQIATPIGPAITACGIAVAVPAVWLFNYFTNKVTSFGVEMENSASELVDYFIKQRTKALKG